MPCRTRRLGLDVEGLGIVYLEASAVARAVIAGESGGARKPFGRASPGMSSTDATRRPWPPRSSACWQTQQNGSGWAAPAVDGWNRRGRGMSPPGGCMTSCKADSMPGIRIVDETWVAAPLPAVAAVIGDAARWPAWWPDLQLQVTERRGLLGVRWAVAATVRGPGGDGKHGGVATGLSRRRLAPLLPPTGSGGPADVGSARSAGGRAAPAARATRLLGDQGRVGDMAGPNGARRQIGAAVASPHARRVHEVDHDQRRRCRRHGRYRGFRRAIPSGPGRSRAPKSSLPVRTGALSGFDSPSTPVSSRTRTSSLISGVATTRWSGISSRARCRRRSTAPTRSTPARRAPR